MKKIIAAALFMMLLCIGATALTRSSNCNVLSSQQTSHYSFGINADRAGFAKAGPMVSCDTRDSVKCERMKGGEVTIKVKKDGVTIKKKGPKPHRHPKKAPPPKHRKPHRHH